MSLGTNVSFDSRTRRFTDCHDLGKGYSACVHLPPNSDNVRLPLLLYLTANGARGTFTEAPALAAWAGVGQCRCTSQISATEVDESVNKRTRAGRHS